MNEMVWTVRWFEHQRAIWEKRSTTALVSQSRGHQCYAEKQVILWNNFTSYAREELSSICKDV